MTDDEYERIRRLFGTHKSDQVQAATADARRSVEGLGDRGARAVDVSEQVAVDLMNWFREVLQEARTRYEDASPEGERKRGQVRWERCPHITGGVQVMHWHAIMPRAIVCERCAPPGGVCHQCGRKEDRLTAVTLLVDERASTIAHASLCGECNPEGADAPVA